MFVKSETPPGDTLNILDAAGDSDYTEILLQKLEELEKHREAFEKTLSPLPFHLSFIAK